MPGLADSRSRRLALFGSLYFAQGAILSYFLTFNILYLRAHGFAADQIGLFQGILVLPFVLKLLLGMLSDRFSLLGLGHRFPYILFGLLIQCTAFVMLPVVPLSAGGGPFFVLALCAALGMALYDTCTDGLAVEATPEHERGLIQGVMVGARAAGILCALLLGGALVEGYGWTPLFIVLAALSLPALALTLLFWDRSAARPDAQFDWSAFRLLGTNRVWVLALMGVIYTLALDGVLSFLSYHPAAGSLADIGVVSGLVAISMAGRIVGALFSGRLTDHLGYRRSLRAAVMFSALACIGLSLDGGHLVLALLCFVFGSAYGYYTAVYAAVAMALCDRRIAASMFAIFMMFLNIGVAGGQALGGVITQLVGFAGLAWAMALVGLVNLLLVRGVRAE